jgi:hypothetical protein
MQVKERLIADRSSKAIHTIDYLPPVAALSTVFGGRTSPEHGYLVVQGQWTWQIERMLFTNRGTTDLLS